MPRPPEVRLAMLAVGMNDIAIWTRPAKDFYRPRQRFQSKSMTFEAI
jgi:hypothetical protein